MGQRTQAIIEITNFKYGEKETFTGFYYNQWGLAKMQLWDIVRMVTTYFDYGKIEMPQQLHKAVIFTPDKPLAGNVTPENTINWLNHQHNNNGGFLLKLVTDNYQITSGELYLFNDPEAEGESCVNRVVSLAEYIQFNPEYFSGEFITMFTNLLDFYNIKIMGKSDDE